MKLIALNSGGIDSPVAMHRLLEHGHGMEAVVFDLQPFTAEDDIQTAVESVKQLEEVHDEDIPLHIIPHGFVQEQFLDEIGDEYVQYNCLFSRRVMLRTAERFARENGGEGLLTGESLGQVASQTLDNLRVTGDAVDLPVLRPLVGMNKNEIIAVAKEIETYDISTQGGVQCAATIDYPETHGVIDEMHEIEKRFDVEAMVEKALSSRRTVRV